jgi:hypothetical protein
MTKNKQIESIKEVLKELREQVKVLIAILYGSFAKGIPHKRLILTLPFI